MCRSLLIFSNVNFKIAARRPYWIFLFPGCNFSLALNINSKLQWHNTYVYGQEPIDFQWHHFLNGLLVAILDLPPPKEVGGGVGILDSPCPSVCPSVCRRHGFRSISQVWFGISILNFICMLMVAIGRSLSIFSDVTFKMATWRPYWIFWFPDSNFTLALNINLKIQWHNTYLFK